MTFVFLSSYGLVHHICRSHFAMNPCFERTSHSLGRIYKRSRRFLPVEVGRAYSGLLLAIKPYFQPDNDISSAANVERSRTTVKEFASLLVMLATHTAEGTPGHRVALSSCDLAGGAARPAAKAFTADNDTGDCNSGALTVTSALDLPCTAPTQQPMPYTADFGLHQLALLYTAADAVPDLASASLGDPVAIIPTAEETGHHHFVGSFPIGIAESELRWRKEEGGRWEDLPLSTGLVVRSPPTRVPIHFHIKDLPGSYMTSLHMKFRAFRARNQHLWPSRSPWANKNISSYARTPWTRAEDSELRIRKLAFEDWRRTLDDVPAACIHAATSSDAVSKFPTALGIALPVLPSPAAVAEPDSPLPPGLVVGASSKRVPTHNHIKGLPWLPEASLISSSSGADLAVDRLWADTHIPELSLTTDLPVKMSRFYLMAQDTKLRIPHIFAEACPALALRNAPCWDPYDPSTGVAGWARNWSFSHYRCAACGADSGNMVCVDCQELYMKVQHLSRRTSDDTPVASTQTGALTDVPTVHVPSAAIRAQPDFPDFSASVRRSAALDFGSDALGEYRANFDFASSSIDSPQPVRVTRTPTDLKWQPKLYPGS